VRTDEMTKSWRQATAVRVFVLALIIGQALSTKTAADFGPLITTLGIVGVSAIAIDSLLYSSWDRWLPLSEGAVSAFVIGLSGTPLPVLPYLAVPVVCAGIRGGWWSTISTWLVIVIGIAAGIEGATGQISLDSSMATWLIIGAGAGALAAWQSRGLRATQEANRPILEAHRLVAQLRDLSQTQSVRLDPGTSALQLVNQLGEMAEAATVVFVVDELDRVQVLAHRGEVNSDHKFSDETGTVLQLGHSGDVLVQAWLDRKGIDKKSRRKWQQVAEQHMMPIDAALLFDQVRGMATSEERERIAQDMHDGVAQDVASLGYFIDTLEAHEDPQAAETIDLLRKEVSRVVQDLRHSIFELRQPDPETQSIAEILNQLAEDAVRGTQLSTSVMVQPEAEQLPRSVQRDIIAIAREAVLNARKHSAGSSIRLELHADGSDFRMVVQDNGTGKHATTKSGHYGLQTMQERAQRIGAELSVQSAPGVGTKVCVTQRRGEPK
jgi:signal transduction histidine kinase